MASITFVFFGIGKMCDALEGWVAILGGAACGLVGSIPAAVLLEGVLKRGMRAKVAHGLAGTLVSFGIMSAALVAVRTVARYETLAFGTAMMTAFLLFWGAEAVRAWVTREGDRGSEGRN